MRLVRMVVPFTLSVALLVVACAGGSATAPPQGSAGPAGTRLSAPSATAAAPNVIPLMPDFWAFWDRAEGKPAAERVALLKEVAIAPHRDFYEKVVGVPSDERLTEFLDVLGPAIPALRRIDGEFKTQLPGAWKSFLAVYPDLDRSLPLYVGPSLFTSSGQSRELDGRTIVFYGLDVVAVVLSDVTDHRPDIHHEMFHAYHWQRNPAMAAVGRDTFSKTRTSPMYNDLWTEGLALYATRRLNPDAPLSIVLSSKDLPEKGPAVLAQVAGELRRKLDVTNLDEVGDYFFFHTRRADLPSRSAYFVGLRLVEEVAKTKSMDEMLALHGDALRKVVDEGLRTLEAGS